MSSTPCLPAITSVTGPTVPLPQTSASATITVAFADAATNDTHTCQFAWDDGSVTSTGVLSSAATSCAATHVYTAAGVYPVGVTVTDDNGYSAVAFYRYVVVYDPSAGFVTGGGWIQSPAGAYTADLSLTGKTSFGFVSKYKKGMTVPTGETEFEFQTASSVSRASLMSGSSFPAPDRSTRAPARSTVPATSASC